MTKVKEKVLELAAIAKECPENLQAICFELLLKHHLDSLSARPNKNAEPGTPAPAAAPPSFSGPSGENKKPAIEDVVKGQDDISEADLHIKLDTL